MAFQYRTHSRTEHLQLAMASAESIIVPRHKIDLCVYATVRKSTDASCTCKYRDGHTCANKESVTYPGEPYETFTACGNYIKFTQKKLTESQYNAEKKIRNTLLNKCGLRAQDKPMFLNPSIPEDRILLLPYGIYHLWLSYAFIRHNC